MPITVHNKLVRDRIPEIITASGSRAQTRTLGVSEIRAALIAKLADEVEQTAEEKRSARGAFLERVFLEHVEGPAYHGE